MADGREITLFQTVSFWSPTSWSLTVYEYLCQHCHLSFENKSCNPPFPCNCHRSMSCGWTLWPTWVWVPRASTPTTWERSPAQKVINQLCLLYPWLCFSSCGCFGNIVKALCTDTEVTMNMTSITKALIILELHDHLPVVRNCLFSLMPWALLFFMWMFWQHCKGCMYRHWNYNEHDKCYRSLSYVTTAWPLTRGEKLFIFSYAFAFIFLPTVFATL